MAPGWRWSRDRKRRACSPRSAMPTTALVIVMTRKHREKVQASAALPRSSEARYPQGTGPSAFPPPGLPRRRCAKCSACSFTTCIECPPTPSAGHSKTGRHRGSSSAALPHLGCAHAQASAGPVCMCARAAACRVQRCTSGLRNQPRRVWTQPRWSIDLQPKPLGELTLRGAQTGRNDWAASEPVTDNLFTAGAHHEEDPHPQLSRP